MMITESINFSLGFLFNKQNILLVGVDIGRDPVLMTGSVLIHYSSGYSTVHPHTQGSKYMGQSQDTSQDTESQVDNGSRAFKEKLIVV